MFQEFNYQVFFCWLNLLNFFMIPHRGTEITEKKQCLRVLRGFVWISGIPGLRPSPESVIIRKNLSSGFQESRRGAKREIKTGKCVFSESLNKEKS
ncbi:MAG: hypothetical protein B6245_15185 [Desulfobacteraceae bacterium 4572_88]|nr:MAG: hypothetical protein B6245_15185 [Desulfobacteraceae bacterium 4572_88]